MEGIPIVIRHLDNPEITAFAKTQFERWYKSDLKRLKDMQRNQFDPGRQQMIDRTIALFPKDVVYGEADLNDDSVPELFIQFGDSGYCGSAGCMTFIYRHTASGFEYICQAYLDDPIPVGDPHGIGIVLAAKNYGFHQIESDAGVIRWHRHQKYDSGELCSQHFRTG